MSIQTDVNLEVVAQEEAQNISGAEVQGQRNPQKNDEEKNWQKTRELLETQKREIEARERELHRVRDELARIANLQKQQEPDELETLSGDDILTVKQAEKIAERKFKKLIDEAENLKGEDKARAKFIDYDAIVTKENLERLRHDEPDIFEEIAKAPTLFGKAITAYSNIKRLVGSQEGAENQQKLEKNLSKPRSVNSLGNTGALSQANLFEKGLTPELKKQLLNEMVSASKRG